MPTSGLSGQQITGIAYDNIMQKHMCKCENPTIHRESGGRLQSIWARLREVGILRYCEKIKTRKATTQELQTVHSEKYVSSYLDKMQVTAKTDHDELEVDVTDVSTNDLNLIRLPCGGLGIDSETVWDPCHTPKAARIAVGCVVDLATKVARGELRNGMAIVRPPGHHAGRDTAMGSCYFNSIAITASILKQKLNLRKVLIFDWDIHHGNGTQNTFYEDPNVLTISIHRYDKGLFFPGTGAITEVGNGSGTGFNVNVAWDSGSDVKMGDPEYLAAFRCVVLPIAKMFSPDIILVSAGFNAVAGQAHENFNYRVSPACFANMTRKLIESINSKIVLALEGGHDLPAICDASESCMRALLLSDPMPAVSSEERNKEPNQAAVKVLEKVIQIQQEHWPQIKRMASYTKYSQNEAERHEKEEVETISALAALSMGVTSEFENVLIHLLHLDFKNYKEN
ncbi:uncharacterized protein TRIADDRAFT_23354 [Trichoplax adhaerens]|uniref:histone deacetylase n=1 Tax=Trichoplax adhaerens TaxID=10228 RepID=B3RQL7_TRIAD|nr:hypothetical protein TRIADDRAFT_23354 [Trichoplax adhaerens]EDV26715.1 hypothetical protein TRIADDRAFT_23354 [Trichoplax adhaerens]|eukprot:XP_002110711.1 hypothetical protein TRIADDRAFT_23354 [Trichoplax adhaerens]